jgi:hypothetical protein
MKRLYKLYLAIVLAACLAGTGVAYAQIGGGVGWFNIVQDVMVSGSMQVNNDLAVMDDATFTDQLSSADLTASDDVVVGDDLTVADDATIGSDLTVSPGTTETIGFDEQIDPTGTYHRITSSAARGTDNIAIGTAGDVLILHNVGAQTITLTDTGTLLLSGNAALSANDMIWLISTGVAWVQISPEGDN